MSPRPVGSGPRGGGGLRAGAWLEKGEAFLAERKVPEARANAEFILAHVLSCGRAAAKAVPERVLDGRQAHHFWNLVKARGRRVPLAYVLGSQPFCGLDILVDPRVLVPRPETEELVGLVVEAARGAPAHILEVGTGSGCIAVALARALPSATVYASEISDDALRLAAENARRHQVEGRIRFLREDLFRPGRSSVTSFRDGSPSVAGPWADILVSNPPYIPSADLRDLEPEVLAEPHLALDGGPDGLDAVRAIVEEAPGRLKSGGLLALEIGAGQARAVRDILSGWEGLEVRRDLQGVERFALARRPMGK